MAGRRGRAAARRAPSGGAAPQTPPRRPTAAAGRCRAVGPELRDGAAGRGFRGASVFGAAPALGLPEGNAARLARNVTPPKAGVAAPEGGAPATPDEPGSEEPAQSHPTLRA